MMKKKVKIFDIVLIVIFTVFSLVMIIPVYKVLVDSFDLKTAYGMKLFPEQFGFAGYKTIFTNPTMFRPFLISCYTTVMGTVMGLLISVLGAYVLIQWKMPGRAFIANVLLFTMIFNGGMIPTYLVMKDFHLTNNLWGVILLPAINVYNLVLMKNFFEGIPVSLMESAEIDGCSHFRILYKIVLPLSKAALASIGLMYAVGYWNDYTNYKLYITNSNLYNFQMKLRALIMGSDLPSAVEGATENTVKNAAVIVAILPFMIIYPFCQKYFVQGIVTSGLK